jgi:hypothetical protein
MSRNDDLDSRMHKLISQLAAIEKLAAACLQMHVVHVVRCGGGL